MTWGKSVHGFRAAALAQAALETDLHLIIFDTKNDAIIQYSLLSLRNFVVHEAIPMSDRTANLKEALQREEQAKQVEHENYQILMLHLATLRAGKGVKLQTEVFRNWKASMQERMERTTLSIALAKSQMS